MPLHKPRTINLTSVAQLNKLPTKQVFSGIYRIGEINTNSKLNTSKILNIDLHDATAFQVGQCESSLLNWLPTKLYQLVQVKGYVEHTTSTVQILEIEPFVGMENINVLQNLPRILCADSIWLDRLINVRKGIESPSLGRFVDTLFSDDEIAFSFLQVPASSKFHHNQIGGLLSHSVEAAEITYGLDYANEGLRDIASVAALLHDIGKVRTLGNNLKSTTIGKMVGHDSLTLEICANALKELDQAWSDAALTLRHIWTCASAGAKYGFESNSTLATKVQYADRLSVARFYDKQIFKASNKTKGLAWDGKKYFWRPSDEVLNNERSRLCVIPNLR
ncbi:MAG: HD domain-containing protein [Pseudomonadota bacterium]